MAAMSEEAVARVRSHAHELAAMAKTGLAYATNDYDRDRYSRVLRIAEELAGMTFPDGLPQDREYERDIGVITPKTGCSAAAFDDGGRLLLIRRADTGRWALPGGWGEVGTPASANALRELREETGFEGVVERLLGIFDNRRLGGTSPYHIWTLLFRVRLTGGEATPSPETPAVAFFARDELPEDMSVFQRALVTHALADAREAVFQ